MNYKLYTVKKGDSLYTIAKANNTTASVLISLNNLTSNNLSIGQQLKIPVSSNSSSGTTYTVKGGDTIIMGNNEYNLFKNVSKKDAFFEHLFICNF